MATEKQKEAVKDLSENIGKPIGKIMRDSGYSVSTSETPKRLTESKGFKEELDKHGLNEELIISSLVEDIKAKPGKRLGELQYGGELIGMKKAPEDLSGNVQLTQIIVMLKANLEAEVDS